METLIAYNVGLCLGIVPHGCVVNGDPMSIRDAMNYLVRVSWRPLPVEVEVPLGSIFEYIVHCQRRGQRRGLDIRQCKIKH